MMSIETGVDRWIGVFAVDVVDTFGEGVPGETVRASYHLADGRTVAGVAVTDGRGRALFMEELESPPLSTDLWAAGETLEPVDLSRKTTFVIET